MVCDPADRIVVVNVAMPELSRATLPKTDEPSLNVMVPVGKLVPWAPPGEFGTTLTLKTTGCPTVDGFGVELKPMETEFLLTT